MSASQIGRNRFRPQVRRLEDRSVPSFGWASAVGGYTGNGVATDAAGNVYVAGSFSGSFTPAGSATPLTSAGGSDAFVTKYSRNGTFQWAVRMGGTQGDEGTGIVADINGNVFVVGSYTGPAVFGTTTLAGPAYSDGFLAKLDTNTGSVSWARNGLAFGSPNGAGAPGVACDAAGNAYLSTTAGLSLTVTRVSSVGSLDWQFRFDQAEAITGGIAVSGSNVYLTGDFVGTVDFDPGRGRATLRAGNGAISGFVLKLTTAGSYVWSRMFASSSGTGLQNTCVPDSIGVDAAGNVYTSGSFTGTADFNPGSANLVFNGGTGAGFVTKLNPSGNFVWARQFGVQLGGESGLTGPMGLGGAMAVDAAGAVYLTTGFTGTVDFNPGAGVFNLTSAGGYDTAVVKLDTNGAFQWAVRAGAAGDDYGTGIAVNGFGEVYVTGRVGAGTVDFDPTQTYLDDRDLLTGPTGFLWQLTQP